jgi:hypothetical protein
MLIAPRDPAGSPYVATNSVSDDGIRRSTCRIRVPNPVQADPVDLGVTLRACPVVAQDAEIADRADRHQPGTLRIADGDRRGLAPDCPPEHVQKLARAVVWPNFVAGSAWRPSIGRIDCRYPVS